MAKTIDIAKRPDELSEEEILYRAQREGLPTGFSIDDQKDLVDRGLREVLAPDPLSMNDRVNTGDVNTRGVGQREDERAQLRRDKAQDEAEKQAAKEAKRVRKETRVGASEEGSDDEDVEAPYSEYSASVLREELERRSLPTDGNKQALVDRLDADDAENS